MKKGNDPFRKLKTDYILTKNRLYCSFFFFQNSKKMPTIEKNYSDYGFEYYTK